MGPLNPVSLARCRVWRLLIRLVAFNLTMSSRDRLLNVCP